MSERTFKDFGLPAAIRTDNGVPFASGNALFGLSRLAVWWLRLGINIQRIKPGHPQQNGRQERMHLTLKKEATKAAFNFLQQQELLFAKKKKKQAAQFVACFGCARKQSSHQFEERFGE